MAAKATTDKTRRLLTSGVLAGYRCPKTGRFYVEVQSLAAFIKAAQV